MTNTYSQTQLANIMILAGIIVPILGKFGLSTDANTVSFFIGAVWSIGWTIYSWYQRYKKGDLTLGGFRK